MEGGLGLVGAGGGGGGSSGASTNESRVSKLEVVEAEASSYPAEAELELRLGLRLGSGGGGGGAGRGKTSAWGECGRILTAKDFPSALSQPHRAASSNVTISASIVGAVSGTKRAAESVSHEGRSPATGSQVVGWPPIKAYRMNSLVNQAKVPRAEEKSIGENGKSKDVLNKKICDGNKVNTTGNEKVPLGLVKVNMDGVPIGRKVDLSAHACYKTLARTLEKMFFRSTLSVNSAASLGEKHQGDLPSNLFDGPSEFVLTYEDKEGDWMLVGDVPWGMFLCSVRRLRIMRTCEANGLAPRFQERNQRQRSKPI